MSLPSLGAWIEIRGATYAGRRWITSLPSLGAWIEIDTMEYILSQLASLPSLGAWIEIYKTNTPGGVHEVAPFIGSVD